MNYERFVSSKCKPGEDILDSLTPEACHLDHMGKGLCGEAGEVIDCIKKHTAYNQPLDEENLSEELGDCLFFIAGMANYLGKTLEELMKQNEEKLNLRYSKGYSDEEAKKRSDKNA